MAELTGDSLMVAVELQGTETFCEAEVTVVLTLPSTTVTEPQTVPEACVTLTVKVQLDVEPADPLAGGGLLVLVLALPPQPATNTRSAAPTNIGKRRTCLTSYT